MVIVVFLKQKN